MQLVQGWLLVDGVSADLGMTRLEAGGWRWMQDKIYGICGYRPIESQGCEHFLSAKQLHTDHLGEFKKNAVQDAAPFKIIFPSTIHHSPLTSRC